jgi:hypothetical protein
MMMSEEVRHMKRIIAKSVILSSIAAVGAAVLPHLAR